MHRTIGLFLLAMQIWLSPWLPMASAQETSPPAAGNGGPAPEAPKRIILEEKQVSAGAQSLEMKLDNGTQVRLRAGAQASLTKFEMSDAKGDVHEGLKISEGEVGVECPPDMTFTVWVPDGDISMKGGEHTFIIVKDGWRQACMKPVAYVVEKKTGAKWEMSGQQKVRVERLRRVVLITHEKDSEKALFVAVPAGWIVHTLKGEDLKSEDQRITSGRGIDELRGGEPARVPIIVRLDPADALLIIPGDLPAARPEAMSVEPPSAPPPPGGSPVR